MPANDDKKQADPRVAAEEAKALADLEADKKRSAEEIEKAKERAEFQAKQKQLAAAKDKELDKIQAQEEEIRKGPPGEYGPFADHPAKFVVTAEMVGKHKKGEVISYRELIAYADAERKRPHVGATRANAERLVAKGSLRPLVIIPGD